MTVPPDVKYQELFQVGIVRRPMGIGPWIRIGVYAHYADLVHWNIQEGRYFEALAVAILCLDVLAHNIVDGLLLHHKGKLNPVQIDGLERIEQDRLTAGRVIDELEKVHVLEPRLLRALRRLNKFRNSLVHPIQGGRLKKNAIMPGKGDDKETASRVYRLLCHIIDVGGGQSPRTQEREIKRYIRERVGHLQRIKGHPSR